MGISFKQFLHQGHATKLRDRLATCTCPQSYDHVQAWPRLKRNQFFCDAENPRKSRIIFLSSPGYDLDELIFASVNVQSGVQPMRAQVLQNREAQSSAVAQANAHVIDMYDDGEDFGFYPDFFEFD